MTQHTGPSSPPGYRAVDPIAAAERQRSLLLRFLRAGFVVLVVTVMLLTILDLGADVAPGKGRWLARYWWQTLSVTVVITALVLLIDIYSPTKKPQTIGGFVVGLVAGLLITLALGFVIDLVAVAWELNSGEGSKIISAVKVIVGICMCYLGISIVLQTQDDFRLVIPYVEFAKQLRGSRPMLLDTSALIDGRIVDIGATGFVQTPLVIPTFVIDELQLLADSADHTRRAKGRRGLEMVARLQRSPNLDVSLDNTPVPGKAVDQMLVEFARRMPGLVVTNDLALGKICSLQGVKSLNMHDLAMALKPPFVVGDPISLKLIRPGEQPGQAVGYLDDGTMVIAENGGPFIGQRMEMFVRGTLQTQAGRLVFARIEGEDEGGPGPSGSPEPRGSQTADDPEESGRAGGEARGESRGDSGGDRPAGLETGERHGGDGPRRYGPYPPRRPGPGGPSGGPSSGPGSGFSGPRNPRRGP